MKNMKKLLKLKLSILLSMALINCFVLYAQNNIDNYPESASIRSELIDYWFEQDIALLKDQSSSILQNELGDYFLVRAEEKNNVMEIIVAPLVLQTLSVQESSLVDNKEPSFQATDDSLVVETWPKDGIGSWILYRDAITGKNIKIRYYFSYERELFIEFLPGKNKSYANFSIFSALVAHNAPVPVSLDYFYTASLKDIKILTRKILPWHYVSMESINFADTIQMVRKIRTLLPDAKKAEMFTSDTSSYDFLKWIVDGLVVPLVGGKLYDEPLYVATIEPDFMMGERNNTHKSYDFVRNLAAAAISADTSLPYTYKTSNADVKIEPFSVFTNEDGKEERINFVTDIGYQVNILKPLLYLLTATQGDLFYLGAVRELKEASALGRTAEQYYYENAVAFFSWFDEQGKFHVTVFENGAEFTLQQFVNKYSDSFVYLVRVKSSMNFFPEEPEISDSEEIQVNTQ